MTKKEENILLVSNYPSDTGYAWWLMEHFWSVIAKQFSQVGSKTFLAYPKITQLSETIIASDMVTTELSIPWKTKTEKNKVIRFIKQNNIKNIYFTDQQFFSLQFLSLRLNGVKRIVIHDHTPGDRPNITGIKGFLKVIKHTLPFFNADAVLCVSELMRQRNIGNSRFPRSKCLTVQNGINPVFCNNNPKKIIYDELNLSNDTITIITSGRAHPYKRFDFIIDCAKQVIEQELSLDIVFLLVGDGPSFEELKEKINQYGLNKQVLLLGFRSDIRELLCASDIAMHAALGEGFSLSITEYMSAGLPVLVPDIPSVKQAINHDFNGYIYPVNNSDRASELILKLASNGPLRTEMGATAKNDANSKYTLDLCTGEFIDAIKQCYFR